MIQNSYVSTYGEHPTKDYILTDYAIYRRMEIHAFGYVFMSRWPHTNRLPTKILVDADGYVTALCYAGDLIYINGKWASESHSLQNQFLVESAVVGRLWLEEHRDTSDMLQGLIPGTSDSMTQDMYQSDTTFRYVNYETEGLDYEAT